MKLVQIKLCAVRLDAHQLAVIIQTHLYNNSSKDIPHLRAWKLPASVERAVVNNPSLTFKKAECIIVFPLISAFSHYPRQLDEQLYSLMHKY